MKHLLRLLAPLFVAAAVPAFAVPVDYRLDTSESRVQYRVPFGNSEIFGTMPVRSARVALDFDMASNSSVSVTLNAAGATASFPFAASTLKGATVLNTAQTSGQTGLPTPWATGLNWKFLPRSCGRSDPPRP